MHKKSIFSSPSGIIIVLSLLLFSCYKRQIQFGNGLEDSNTRIVVVDTVTPVISSFILDSFPTSATGVMIAGRCVDSFFGATNAAAYFQISLPSNTGVTEEIPFDAVYDSLALIIKPEANYYGDTSKPQTFSLHELAYQPEYVYASKLYNTTTIEKLPVVWAADTRKISPNRGDSFHLRMNDNKGITLFNKIKSKSEEVQSDANFLNYIKGFCLKVNDNDNGAVFTFSAADSSAKVKLYYHVSLPYFEKKVVEFPLTRADYQFNQIVSDRSATSLKPQNAGQREFPSSKTFPYAFTQVGTGVLMKIKFPSLREILKLSATIKLLNAQLIIRPVEKTYDNFAFPLPSALYLAETDATNSIGYTIADSAGTGTQFAKPIIDEIYRLDTRYTFNLTKYIESLLSTSNSAENGLFLIEENPGEAKKLSRAVMGSWDNSAYRTQLILTVMTID